uniref:Uncharacterized protein n=1 Tax=Angiostrongylus cantonensis TaxID=6313 RepID=A0A0K0DEK8_ANGCA
MGLLVCLFQLFILKSFKKLLLIFTVESFRVGFFVKIILLMKFLKGFGIYLIVIIFLIVLSLSFWLVFLRVKKLLFGKYSVVGMIYSFPLIIIKNCFIIFSKYLLCYLDKFFSGYFTQEKEVNFRLKLW